MTVFSFNPSKRLIIGLIISHSLALGACFVNALPIMVQMLLAVGLAGHCYWAIHREWRVWHGLRYSKALGWEMAGPSSFIAVYILPSTVITPFALLLHVEIQDSHTHIYPLLAFGRTRPKTRQTILILPDNLGQVDYRHLAVKLKTTYKIKSKSSELLVKSV
jgi:hypothetical protein